MHIFAEGGFAQSNGDAIGKRATRSYTANLSSLGCGEVVCSICRQGESISLWRGWCYCG